MYDNFHKLITAKNLMATVYPHPHTFMPRKSCLINLFQSFQGWIAGVDIIYLDYLKGLLIMCFIIGYSISWMKGYGVFCNLLLWLMDFLNQRKQRVSVDGAHFRWCRVISDVPQ